jgi:WD40 repeat protein
VSPDDGTVYVGGSDCKIYVYQVKGGGSALEQTKVIEGKHLKPIHSIALSPDGTKLAAGDEKDVCVYDASPGAGYATLVGRGRWCFHLQRVTCLAWSPDSSVLASGGADDSMYLWRVESKATRVHYPFCHRGGFTGLAFVGDREILSCGADSVVHRWDVSKDVSDKLS